MNELLNLQNKFQDYLLHSNSDFQHCIINTKKVSAEKRLAIYGDAYRSRLIEALQSNYPILEKYLGGEQFEELALTYLKDSPSCYRSIRWFGDELSLFLTQHSPYKQFLYLSELAQFEWAQTLVFDAEEGVVFQLEDIIKIPADSWAEMKFKMHPSMHCLNLSWNVIQIWQTLSEDQTPPEPIESPEPVSWILWRKEFINQFCSVTEDEAWAINAVKQGFNFAELCEGLCQWIDEENAPIRAASLLKGWIAAGLIAEIVI